MYTELTKTNNWKYRIEIKDQFEDETTPELTKKLCESMTSQLKAIQGEVEKGNLIEGEKDYLDNELEDLISNFEFLRDLSSGKIKKTEWNNLSFNGNFEGLFNDYLNQTYDLGDTRVQNEKSQLEKFMWIG